MWAGLPVGLPVGRPSRLPHRGQSAAPLSKPQELAASDGRNSTRFLEQLRGSYQEAAGRRPPAQPAGTASPWRRRVRGSRPIRSKAVARRPAPPRGARGGVACGSDVIHRDVTHTRALTHTKALNGGALAALTALQWLGVNDCFRDGASEKARALARLSTPGRGKPVSRRAVRGSFASAKPRPAPPRPASGVVVTG